MVLLLALFRIDPIQDSVLLNAPKVSVQGHCLRDHKQQQLKGVGREEKMVQALLSDQIPESNIIKDSDGGLRYFPSQGRTSIL